MKRILVISGDILPYSGLPTTGAGLRAWGIGKGLESRGYEVLLAMPQAAVGRMVSVPEDIEPLLYKPRELPRLIAQKQPDVVVLQHWRLARYLDPSLEIPLVIDFHGPLLLETQFQANPERALLQREKIEALHKADFFTCAGEKQRCYFFPWLMLAGCDLREDIIKVIPVSLSPDLPVHESRGELSFVYGGVFLPWQDPISGLSTLVECLEHRQHGLLKFFGGKHPIVTVPTERFEKLRRQLQQSSRVQIQAMIPRDQLIREYCQSHIAIDIMQRNAERELAFTTRTVEYLWCGLPVIYNNYAELTDYIRKYKAGWTLDPQDHHGLTQIIEKIVNSPDMVAERGANAQRLVREQLTWDKTIEPLDVFCRSPRKREKGQMPLFDSRPPSRTIMPIRKIAYHLQHEGIGETGKRIWMKLFR